MSMATGGDIVGTRIARAWIARAAVAVLALFVTSAAGQTSAPPEAKPETRPEPKPVLPPLPKWTADPEGEFLDYSKAWPERVRVGEGPNAKLGVIRDMPGEVLGWYQRYGLGGPVQPNAEDLRDMATWREAAQEASPREIAFEGRGAFLVSFEPVEGLHFNQKAKPADRPVLRFKYISVESEQDPAGPPGSLRHVLQRTNFVLYEPYATGDAMSGILPAAGSRGIALVMPGLFGTPDTVIDVMVRRLRQDGWFVLRLLAASSRFTETVTFEFDTRKDLSVPANQLAKVLQSRAAEIAYAVQAAFQHVSSVRPDLANLPRVVVGSSAGAITLPTVVAREPDRYLAAVLIGGGVDYWLINSRSNYRRTADALRYRWLRGEPTEVDERRVDALYLAAAPLDGYHTAKVLRDKPVLMLQGVLDRAVPASLGDLLWARLGKPERILLQVGHEMLFASVAGRLTEISAWLTAASEGRKPRLPMVPPGDVPSAPGAEKPEAIK